MSPQSFLVMNENVCTILTFGGNSLLDGLKPGDDNLSGQDQARRLCFYHLGGRS